jgi:serine/threonine protein kinase
MRCPACGAEVADSASVCADCGAPLPAVAPGALLAGRYEIQALLGAGALGRVYRALDRTLNEVVAVKVLHPETTRSTEVTRRFRNEIKLARRVRHVNVCAIHEYGEDGPLQFVAMELVDGADLQRTLREKGPLPPAEIFEVALQVVRGLAAIHDAGVIHRDLKTSNIVRDHTGAVRLLDFGIAKRRTPTGTLALTGVERVVGTPEYMSPEQIRGDDLDPRSDIYSFGVVLFELSTGTLPFEGKTPLDTMLRQVNEPPPLYGDRAARIPPALVSVLRRALAKDPGGRPASAREIEAELLFARSATLPEAAPSPRAAPDAFAGAQPRTPPRPLTPPPLPPAPPPRPLTPPPLPAAAPPLRPPPLPAPDEPRREPERVDRTEVLPRRARPTPPPPPLVAAREAAAAAALDAERTYIELPPAPSAPGPALRPPPLPEPDRGRRPAPVRPRAWLLPLAAGLVVIAMALVVRSRLAERGGGGPLPSATATPEAQPQEAPPAPAADDAPARESPLAGKASEETAAPVRSKEPVRPTPALASPAAPAPTPRPPARVLQPPPMATPAPTPLPTPTPTPSPVPRARLAIGVRPWAEVEIDGKPYGRSPLVEVVVEPGEHVIDLLHPDYWPRRRRVVLFPGSALRLDVDLTWEAVRRSVAIPARLPRSSSAADPEVERGEAQLREMEWREAIVTLEGVVRRLRGLRRQRHELARAYFYLGVAHLELDEATHATTSFLAALEHDGKLRPPPAVFSPRVMSFFNHVRTTVKEKP